MNDFMLVLAVVTVSVPFLGLLFEAWADTGDDL